MRDHEPAEITSGDRAAMLIAKEDWEAVQETLHLLSIPGMRESIVEGMHTPIDPCDREPGW